MDQLRLRIVHCSPQCRYAQFHSNEKDEDTIEMIYFFKNLADPLTFNKIQAKLNAPILIRMLTHKLYIS